MTCRAGLNAVQMTLILPIYWLLGLTTFTFFKYLPFYFQRTHVWFKHAQLQTLVLELDTVRCEVNRFESQKTTEQAADKPQQSGEQGQSGTEVKKNLSYPKSRWSKSWRITGHFKATKGFLGENKSEYCLLYLYHVWVTTEWQRRVWWERRF